MPDRKLAKFIINHSKKLGVLISIDGPYHNIIKIKPPITFKKHHDNILIKALDKSLKKYNI